MRFLAFATRRALSGIWRNRLMTGAALLTMTLMLLLAAGLVVVLSGLDAGLRFVEGKVEVVAYLSEAADAQDARALETELARRPDVASVDHVSKDEALARYRAELRARGREDLLETIGFNPLPASLEVRLRDPSRADDVVQRLRSAAIVDEVQETARVARTLSSLAATLRGLGVLVISVVGLVVLAIVVNAIRVGVLARREEIAVMRLVGASDAYVRWPFVLEGILVGLGGALLALGVLALAATPLSEVARSIVAQVPVGFDERLAQGLVALLLLAGPGLGFLGAWLSVRAHLRH